MLFRSFLSRSRLLHSMFPVTQNLPQITLRLLQCLDVCCDALEFFLRQFVHAMARSTACVTSLQDFSQLCQSEPDPQRPSNDEHPFDGAGCIYSITRICPRSSWQNADPLIVSNRVRTHTRRFGKCPGMKSRGTTVFHHAEYQPSNPFQSQAIYCEGLANQREGGYLQTPSAGIGRPEGAQVGLLRIRGVDSLCGQSGDPKVVSASSTRLPTQRIGTHMSDRAIGKAENRSTRELGECNGESSNQQRRSCGTDGR